MNEELWIFSSYIPIGWIDVLLRRFGSTEFASFVPQWCSGHHFLDAGVGAAVR